MKIHYHHYRYHDDNFSYNCSRAAYEALRHGQIKEHRSMEGTQRSGAHFAEHFTLCVIFDDDGKELARGYAFCSALDQFSRPIGRRISLNRARRDLARNMEQV
jgi:hypothetical protein